MERHFHENSKDFRIYTDFEADNEVDDSSIGNKTTNTSRQNPVSNGYYIVSELKDVLQNGFYESAQRSFDVVKQAENEMTFYFKNNKKDNIMTEEDEEFCRDNNLSRFVIKDNC